MYNRFLEYLKSYDPHKVMSKNGIKIRKAINPIFRRVASMTSKYKVKVVNRAELPKGIPLIFAPTHGFKDDLLFSVATIGAHAYILFGSLPQFYNTFDGITAWLNGSIIVDRVDKQSRLAARDKMEYAIDLGANLMIFPEGVWNKTENLLLLPFFGGIYDVASKKGAMVVPVATHLEGNCVYSSIGEAFDISVYDKKEGLAVLRDKMATLKWELMEKYSVTKRADLLETISPKEYWEQYIEFLISEVDYYDREVENNAHFKDKNVTDYETAFAFMENLIPSKANAFLFRR